jgi:hypothetical protein
MARSSSIEKRKERGKGSERSAITAVRFKPEELARLHAKAKLAFLPLSVYIRQAALGHSMVDVAGRETIIHAGQILVRLEEIQESLDAQGLPEPEHFAEAIAESRRIFRELFDLYRRLGH